MMSVHSAIRAENLAPRASMPMACSPPRTLGAGDGTALEVVCCLIYCGLILGALEQHSTVEQLMIPMIPMKILPLRIARKSVGMAHHFISERALSADILVAISELCDRIVGQRPTRRATLVLIRKLFHFHKTAATNEC